MRIVVRADASPTIGAGHVMRCLALAQAAQDRGHDVHWVSACLLPGPHRRLLDEGVVVWPTHAPSGSGDDLARTIETVKRLEADRLIIDGYCFGREWDERVSAEAMPCLLLDDVADRAPYSTRWLLNQNVYASNSLYASDTSSELLLGLDYLLLRREYAESERPTRPAARRPRKVLVSFGGADPTGETTPMARRLAERVGGDGEVIVLVGASFDGQHLADLENVTVLHDVVDMPGLLRRVDVAVSAAGSTLYELAWMRVPTMAVQTAPNQRLIAEYLAQRVPELTVLRGGGPDATERAIDALLTSPESRASMLDALYIADDGRPTDRVIDALERG